MATALLVTLTGVGLIGFTAWVMISDDLESKVHAPKAWSEVAERLGLGHSDRMISGQLHGWEVQVTFEARRSRYSETKYTSISTPVGDLPLELEIRPAGSPDRSSANDRTRSWKEVPNQDVAFGRHFVVYADDVRGAVAWLQESPAMDTFLWLWQRDHVAALRDNLLEIRKQGWIDNASELETAIVDAVDAAKHLNA